MCFSYKAIQQPFYWQDVAAKFSLGSNALQYYAHLSCSATKRTAVLSKYVHVAKAEKLGKYFFILS